VRNIVIMLAITGMLAAVAVLPYGRDCGQFYRMIGSSSLLLLVGDGVPLSTYGLNPVCLREAKQPWRETSEQLRTRRGNK
jgi:hypothetical protein